MTSFLRHFLFFTIVLFFVISCEQKAPKEFPLVKTEDATLVEQKARDIRDNTAAVLADGFTLKLWASDSLAPDPVAMSIDDFGAVYLTRTIRQKNSEFDIRGHRDWMTASIALQSVEDRRAFLRETFATEKSEENEWLKDLNNDGFHDWRDLAVEKDEIWKLEDGDNDGRADKATRVLSDFNEEVTDVAGAILVRRNDVFLGTGPDMWRLKDQNGDGVLEDKKSISHGYAVHIGFGGHGMSGVVEGPDGKIYWGIGDIGANITTSEGVNHKYPNQGVLVRSNPDGSNFEVFAAGLRNTHEFVFDDYGNIIGADNDGDHQGESERLVYIVDGSDAGWRANWQYGKYTDPKNNGYNVWMDEVLYKPCWEGQAAYIIPPIMNYHNGPTGMTYNPGTALGSKWKNKFFLVEFRGSPSRSHIWAFDLKPSGASFELKSEVDVISGVLPTGMRFGPDGALYFSDWITGWNTKNFGRVWKLDVDETENDLKKERAETQRLMALDYEDQSESVLAGLLKYDDQRIRLKAQFELVNRGGQSAEIFQAAIEQVGNQLERIHGIWGIGQLAAVDLSQADAIVSLLSDSDPEIIAQAAKVIGDLSHEKAGTDLIPLLSHASPRVKFFGAQALGRIKHKAAIQPILDMIEQNADEDQYLRHAGVMALYRIGDAASITALAKNENRTLRLAALLVLRRMQHPDVSLFLDDEDEYLVTEAARAINDDWSIATELPKLAAVLNDDRFTSEPLIRRAINANLRVGGEKELDQLLNFAQRQSVSPIFKAEALATVGTWANPSVLDRVDGRYRGEISRDIEPVRKKVIARMGQFLKNGDPEFLVGVVDMLSNLGISDYNNNLEQIMTSSKEGQVKSAILDALVTLKYEKIQSVIEIGMNDDDQNVRTSALKYLGELEISKENLPGIINPIFTKGTDKEQQQVVQVLGKMPLEKTEDVLENLIGKMMAEKLSPSLTLDLIEAVEAGKSEKLLALIKPLQSEGNTVEAFKETLYGGDGRKGRNFVRNNSTAQCIRCHSLSGDVAGSVGPSLSNIGNILSREQILEALIEPSARLAPGYGSVSLVLKEGQKVTGTLLVENDEELILQTSQAEPLEVPLSRISERKNNPSAMPPMGTLMNKQDIRNVIEYLANLKE
ncbi:MAG: HEAT repeat domain-containing protein [Cyclobacteriaceae bacterium]